MDDHYMDMVVKTKVTGLKNRCYLERDNKIFVSPLTSASKCNLGEMHPATSSKNSDDYENMNYEQEVADFQARKKMEMKNRDKTSSQTTISSSRYPLLPFFQQHLNRSLREREDESDKLVFASPSVVIPVGGLHLPKHSISHENRFGCGERNLKQEVTDFQPRNKMGIKTDRCKETSIEPISCHHYPVKISIRKQLYNRWGPETKSEKVAPDSSTTVKLENGSNIPKDDRGEKNMKAEEIDFLKGKKMEIKADIHEERSTLLAKPNSCQQYPVKFRHQLWNRWERDSETEVKEVVATSPTIVKLENVANLPNNENKEVAQENEVFDNRKKVQTREDREKSLATSTYLDHSRVSKFQQIPKRRWETKIVIDSGNEIPTEFPKVYSPKSTNRRISSFTFCRNGDDNLEIVHFGKRIQPEITIEENNETSTIPGFSSSSAKYPETSVSQDRLQLSESKKETNVEIDKEASTSDVIQNSSCAQISENKFSNHKKKKRFDFPSEAIWLFLLILFADFVITFVLIEDHVIQLKIFFSFIIVSTILLAFMTHKMKASKSHK